MYIAPNSRVILLNRVPIDIDHENTLYFASIGDQINYFMSKKKIEFSRQYYVRPKRGIIKVECDANTIYDCNYMMFQNTAFNNKWFYAFITGVEYVANTTAEITFEIDDLQSWLFEMELGQCFVEREHSLTDVAGDNLIPEGLETGEFIYTDETPFSLFTKENLKIVIAATFYNQATLPPDDHDPALYDFVDAGGSMYSGNYSAVVYTYFDNTNAGASDCADWLVAASARGKADGIVGVFMCPYFIIVNNSSGATSFSWNKKPTSIDGYTPRNNKMFTAPYISLFVKTPDNAAEYPYEYFRDGQYQNFAITTAMAMQPTAMLLPALYKTTLVQDASQTGYALNEGLLLQGWSQCAYNTDTFKAWLAQNGATLLVNGALAATALGTSLAGIKGSLATPFPQVSGQEQLSPNWIPPWDTYGQKPVGDFAQKFSLGYSGKGSQLIGSIAAVGNILAQIHDHSILPPHSRGTTNANVNTANGYVNYYFYNKTIRRDYAKIIDDYFTRYGYATHQIKRPNIYARSRFTYTKTIGCEVHGDIPTDSKESIKRCFNNGITWWADHNNVGDFSLYNNLLGV